MDVQEIGLANRNAGVLQQRERRPTVLIDGHIDDKPDRDAALLGCDQCRDDLLVPNDFGIEVDRELGFVDDVQEPCAAVGWADDERPVILVSPASRPVQIEYGLCLAHRIAGCCDRPELPVAVERGFRQVLVHDDRDLTVDHHELGMRESELAARPPHLDAMRLQELPRFVLGTATTEWMLFQHHPDTDTTIAGVIERGDDVNGCQQVDRNVDRAAGGIQFIKDRSLAIIRGDEHARHLRWRRQSSEACVNPIVDASQVRWGAAGQCDQDGAEQEAAHATQPDGILATTPYLSLEDDQRLARTGTRTGCGCGCRTRAASHSRSLSMRSGITNVSLDVADEPVPSMRKQCPKPTSNDYFTRFCDVCHRYRRTSP